ncbi:ubiquilin-1-like isoform X2 [Gymnodraco acuticeps]|uniref:Ubiquilin-1-like isoform X2 n=1 Tax=Gymnodraco acuticeps TaxID=8218 RepID=A0A6P8VX64_GYMAC|nr:ubiquilin-1-like isoform X2 [Gymnodraco acuticeps]
MSGSERDQSRAQDDRQIAETIHVSVKGPAESRECTMRGDCTVTQLKWSLAEGVGVPAEQLVLIHFGRVLRESELLSHLRARDGCVSLCMIQRPQLSSAAHTCDPTSESVQSGLTAALHPDPDSITPSPTSPLCLVEGLDNFGQTNSGPGFFSSLQRQMDPEMLHRVLGSPFVQTTLSTSSPQLTRQLILSNPQIHQLVQTNPEVGDMLNNADVITQVLELIRNPDMIEDVMHDEDKALGNLQPKQENPENTNRDSGGNQKTDTKRLSQIQIAASRVGTTSSGEKQPNEGERNKTPPVSSDCSDPLGELRADPNPQSPLTAGTDIHIYHSSTKLTHAVSATGDHSQPRADGEPAVWAVCQQPPPLPRPEPRPRCTDAAEPPFVLRKSSAAAADETADPSLPATDAESRTAVSHVEPQSHGGPAPHPAGPTDSGYRGSCSDTYSRS